MYSIILFIVYILPSIVAAIKPYAVWCRSRVVGESGVSFSREAIVPTHSSDRGQHQFGSYGSDIGRRIYDLCMTLVGAGSLANAVCQVKP